MLLLLSFLDLVVEAFGTELGRLGVVHDKGASFSHLGRLCLYKGEQRATREQVGWIWPPGRPTPERRRPVRASMCGESRKGFTSTWRRFGGQNEGRGNLVARKGSDEFIHRTAISWIGSTERRRPFPNGRQRRELRRGATSRFRQVRRLKSAMKMRDAMDSQSVRCRTEPGGRESQCRLGSRDWGGGVVVESWQMGGESMRRFEG